MLLCLYLVKVFTILSVFFVVVVIEAIRGGISLAKLSVLPVQRSYWGIKIDKPHVVPCKVTGKCCSVTIRMVHTPLGDGIVAARV
ncbi:hypothetical protein MKX03_024370 [Papaver bracteatum]|nr:hypothetical protein MKX03_024370 [Papaver bracteatum]